jgi:N-acetylneuraminic acid mutarotase
MVQTGGVKRTRALLVASMTFASACSLPPSTRATDAGPAGTTGGGDDAAEAGPGTAFVWSVAAPCPLARFEANGAFVDGELWVMGGFISSTLQVTRRVDRYDPVTDSWEAGPDLPGAQTHFGVVTAGSDVVVFGGFDGNFSPARPATTELVWRWSAVDSQWSAAPPLPFARAAPAWALLGTELHVAGGLGPDGSTDTSSHVVWDLAGAASWTNAALLPNPRNHGGGAAAGGLFYAVAGRHSWDESKGDQADLAAFDPTTGAWTARAPIPVARSEIGGSTLSLADGRLVAVGGSIATVKPSADVLIYDPRLDSWSSLPPLPEPRKGAVAARLGRRIVVTTGSPTSVAPSDTTWVGCCL